MIEDLHKQKEESKNDQFLNHFPSIPGFLELRSGSFHVDDDSELKEENKKLEKKITKLKE